MIRTVIMLLAAVSGRRGTQKEAGVPADKRIDSAWRLLTDEHGFLTTHAARALVLIPLQLLAISFIYQTDGYARLADIKSTGDALLFAAMHLFLTGLLFAFLVAMPGFVRSRREMRTLIRHPFSSLGVRLNLPEVLYDAVKMEEYLIKRILRARQERQSKFTYLKISVVVTLSGAIALATAFAIYLPSMPAS